MGCFAVVDLEMCKVPRHRRTKEYNYGSEIIQIGAVLLDEDFNMIDEFSTYVSPEYGFLDKQISRLTNISGKDIKDAPAIKDALCDFLRWLPDDAKMVAWSTSDAIQFRRECSYKGIITERLEKVLDESIDCQKIFSRKIDIERPYKLEEAFILTDISPEGRLHDGLVDAKNTAKLFRKMMTEEELGLNEVYRQAHSEEIVHLGSSLGNIIAGLNLELSA